MGTDLTSRLLSNSSWNALAFLVGAGLNLLILPFVIAHLGISEFGYAGLIMACVAPAMIFSNVLAQMSARELAQLQALDSKDKARRIFATALFLALVGGTAITFLLILVGPWLSQKFFNLNVDDINHMTMMYFFVCFGWLCQCFAGVFLALFTARQDYASLAKINITTTVLATVLIWFSVPLWPKAETYLGCLAIGFFVSFGVGIWLACRNFSGWMSLPSLHLDSLYLLIRVGGWQIAAQTGSAISGQIDRYLLGAFLHTYYIGFYNVAQRLEEAIYIGVLKIGEILFPLFSTMLKEREEIRLDVLFRTSWLLNLVAVSFLGPLIPLAREILQLWTSTDIAAEAEQVLIVLALAGILGSGGNVFSYYLLGTGRTRSIAIISLAAGLATISTSFLSLPLLGWHAAGWSAFAGMVVQLLVIVLSIKSSFNAVNLVSRILHLVLAPLAVGSLVAIFLRFLILDNGPIVWWQVLGFYGLCVIMIGCSILTVALMGPYRRNCWHDLKRIAAYFMRLRKN